MCQVDRCGAVFVEAGHSGKAKLLSNREQLLSAPAEALPAASQLSRPPEVYCRAPAQQAYFPAA